MAASPPKETELEQTQSGDEEGDMSRHDEGQGGGLGDFEVKEQDRWLPIANGWSHFISIVSPSSPLQRDLPIPCVTLEATWPDAAELQKHRMCVPLCNYAEGPRSKIRSFVHSHASSQQ